ncbi:MAG: hypothetical protein AABW87_03645, partial [Nanoarchaeota archaeon]
LIEFFKGIREKPGRPKKNKYTLDEIIPILADDNKLKKILMASGYARQIFAFFRDDFYGAAAQPAEKSTALDGFAEHFTFYVLRHGKEVWDSYTSYIRDNGEEIYED